MTDSGPGIPPKAIPEQLIQIAKEQESGAEHVLDQIQVVNNSFEEIVALTKESQDLLRELLPPSEEKDRLVANLEAIATHAENGTYNIEGVFELFQYQDIVRQKLEKVGRRLIEVSRSVLEALNPTEAVHLAPSGRDILEKESQGYDQSKADADAVVAEFFAKLRKGPPPQG